MKIFLYTCFAAGAILIPASELTRKVVFNVTDAVVVRIEKLMHSEKFAEVRKINGDEFDSVINEPNRLVIVDFHNEQTSFLKDDEAVFDAAVYRLPSTVLVARVLADRNIKLMDRMQIHNIPTVLVYRNGELLESFTSKTNAKYFVSVINHHLNNPNSKPNYRNGYVGPLKDGWLPEGIEFRKNKSSL